MKAFRIGSNEPYQYSKNSNPQRLTANELIKKHVSQFKKSDIIIDIGCGTGEISAYLAVHVSKVYAFDISNDAIEYAKSIYYADFHSKLTFFTANAIDFIIPEKVDWAFSANTLHWLKPIELKQALIKIKHILKDDGKLITTFGLRHEPLWSIVDDLVLSKKWAPYFKEFTNPRTFYSLVQYKQLVIDVGFEVVNISQQCISYIFKNSNEMLDFIKSWLPHVNCIPKEKLNEYLDDIGARYPIKKNGTVIMNFNILETCAQKSIKLLTCNKSHTPHPV